MLMFKQNLRCIILAASATVRLILIPKRLRPLLVLDVRYSQVASDESN